MPQVYRFVRGSKLTEQQFYPNNKTIRNTDYTNCNLWGVSFFNSQKSLEDLRAKVSAFRKCKYAEGIIRKNFGTLIIGDNGHINLWRYKNIIIHTSFRII